MTASELAWRSRSAFRDAGDVIRIKAGWLPAENRFAENSSLLTYQPGFSALPAGDGEAREGFQGAPVGAARDRLLYKADEICRNRLSFFDLDAQFLGDPIDWHSDHSAGKRQSLRLAHLIDYRDFASVGDCKLVWEPNRHHQFVVLAQAFVTTGDAAYARKLCELFESWLEQNPFGYGMNWRSPLELGIRLINWVWALDLIRSSGAMPAALWRRIRYTAWLACREISRKYSQGSSSNNHLIGEAAGVFIAASWFTDFPDGERHRWQSRQILEREILAQSYPDGCTREQAFGYQFFVLQFLTLGALVAERTGHPMSRAYLDRLLQQYHFVGFMAEGGADLTMFGDKDDGYVLDLGVPVTDPDMTVATGACLFLDGQLADKVRRWPTELGWLFDRRRIAAGKDRRTGARTELTSRAFRESGHYLLQSGAKDASDALSLLFDCGELGFGRIAAHGHADALSFTLRAAGKSIFVDSGTYDYFSHPQAREYFRSTRAHNTVEVDERPQSEMAGPFMWTDRAVASCLDFTADPSRPAVSGTHDGYRRLRDPVGVTRTITLDSATLTIRIIDRLSAGASHRAKCFFHLDSRVEVEPAGSHEFALHHNGTRLILTVDEKLRTTCRRAEQGDLTGWISRNYHVLLPSVTIVGEVTFDGPIDLTHEIRLLQ